MNNDIIAKKNSGNKYFNTKRKDMIFDICNYIFMIILGIVTIYPFLNVLAISFNDSIDTVKGGITIWPREFTLDNYIKIFEMENLRIATFNSVLRTALGTLTGIISTAMVAFVISRNDFMFKKSVSLMFIITMYVSGGMIPEYMLIRSLGLLNTFEVYLLPQLIFVFNVIVLRSFIDGLPFELQESAKIDGANDLVIFFRIILPLCIPVIATLSLFIAVFHWNSWFDTLLFNQKIELTTLQFELQKILMNAQFTGKQAAQDAQRLQSRVSPEAIRMAMTIFATVPILIVYPFVQNYFVKGLTLGAVKS